MLTKGERREQKRKKKREQMHQGKKPKLWIDIEQKRAQKAKEKLISILRGGDEVQYLRGGDEDAIEGKRVRRKLARAGSNSGQHGGTGHHARSLESLE